MASDGRCRGSVVAPARAGRQRGVGGAWLAALAVLTVAVSTAAQEDPFDSRAIDWRLEQWRALEPLERQWFLAGFALGWHGPAASEAEIAASPQALAGLGAMLPEPAPAIRLAAVLAETHARRPPPRLAMTGTQWLALSVRHRLAVLHGFYGGRYGRAIADRLGRDAGLAAYDAALASARRELRPAPALAPSLLFARLSDWYFYTNHRVEPLVRSIETIVEQIRQP